VKKTGVAAGIFYMAVILAGCEQNNPEARGDREAKSGHFEAAINWYEEALAHGDKVGVHRKMADLFASKLKDSASAAYHYRRIIALNPSREKAESARNALRKMESPASAETSSARSGIPVKSLPPPSQAAAEAEKQGKLKARTYVVQSGDTLSSISRKVYQTPARWKDILDANQNQLPSADDLKAGQTIILP
jgi:LysM repeat protein